MVGVRQNRILTGWYGKMSPAVAFRVAISTRDVPDRKAGTEFVVGSGGVRSGDVRRRIYRWTCRRKTSISVVVIRGVFSGNESLIVETIRNGTVLAVPRPIPFSSRHATQHPFRHDRLDG
ncbi:hypothetical protein D8S78_16505 [Natrialba swarupiae]|nr:hypothetical protein [Natrialba swarupiae]